MCLIGLGLCSDYGNDGLRKALTINLAQSHKWIGSLDEMNKVLDAEDWSASDLLCNLMLAVLKDDDPRTSNVVKKLAMIDGIELNSYRTWPIFRKLREEKAFQDLFLEVYGEPLADEVAAVAQATAPGSSELVIPLLLEETGF